VFRAKLMVSAEDSPALTFYDRTGRERLVLGLYRDEPNLTLYDAENGKVIWSAPQEAAKLSPLPSILRFPPQAV